MLLKDTTAADTPAAAAQPHRVVLQASACVAVVLPALLAFNTAPSATFLNQACAVTGWGVFLGVLAAWGTGWRVGIGRTAPATTRAEAAGLRSLLAAFAVLVLCAVAAMPLVRLPSSLAWSNAGMLLAAAAVAWVAATLTDSPTVSQMAAATGSVHTDGGLRRQAFDAFCVALVAAGVLSSIVALIQVFVPAWADGNWIAAAAVAGRAGANLRQPNHLSSLLLWSMVALMFLTETGSVRRDLGAAIGALFIGALVLSASRTGTIGVLMLALWGVVDRRLSRSARVMLWLAPVLYGLVWFGFSVWGHQVGHAFAGERSFSTQGDISSSRFGIWSITLYLIYQHPWWGVGFGEFNFAWTMTPFPHRPVAFFDHTHNLPLHLVVELGLPLGLAVLALLGHALWRAFAAGRRRDGEDGAMLRCAFMIVMLVSVHSLLEYPLWYAYFLLPAAFAFGLCLGGDQERASAAERPVRGGAAQPIAVWAAAALLVAGGVGSMVDYLRVVVIFQPGDGAAPLAERIAAGQRSVLFAHHADYAAATTAAHPSQAMASFSVATHYLLDTRLMLAWARALNEAGDVERARHVAQRLREFHHSDSDEFFAVCDEPAAPGAELPFQCKPPGRVFDYRDFR